MEMLAVLAHKRGRAVAIVTHDNRILEFADRIIHIEDGKIRAERPLPPGAPGEGRAPAKREPDRAKPQEKALG